MTNRELASYRVSIDAGRLIAGQIEREVRMRAHDSGVTLTLERHKGLLSVLLLASASGTNDAIMQFADAMAELNADLVAYVEGT